MTTLLHEDTFYEYFKPKRHPQAAYDIWGGLGLETFGKDLDIARSYDQAFLWTVVEGDFGNDQWIVPGLRYVNRSCYLITKIPHNWADVEFRVPSRLTSLTALGLRRQILRLQRCISG